MTIPRITWIIDCNWPAIRELDRRSPPHEQRSKRPRPCEAKLPGNGRLLCTSVRSPNVTTGLQVEFTGPDRGTHPCPLRNDGSAGEAGYSGFQTSSEFGFKPGRSRKMPGMRDRLSWPDGLQWLSEPPVSRYLGDAGWRILQALDR